MPETFADMVDRVFRDHQGYTGDGQGGAGDLPIGDRTTAKKPLAKRDLREVLGAFVADADIDARKVKLTPQEYGAQSGWLFDADVRAVLDDVIAQVTLRPAHARLINKTVRLFKSARIWDDVTAASVAGVVTFTIDGGAAAKDVTAFNWINGDYLLSRDGVMNASGVITTAMMNEAEAFDVTANTAALQSWLDALANGEADGYLPAGTYPINDTLQVPTGATLRGLEWQSIIRMVDGVDQLRPVMQIGDVDKPRSHVDVSCIVLDANPDRITQTGLGGAALGVVDSSLPDNEGLRGSAFAVCYTNDSHFDRIFAMDSYRHAIDIAGGYDGRTGTPETYLPAYQQSRGITVGTIYGQGAGDDAFTCHNVDDLTIEQTFAWFATGAHVNNNSGCEVDDLSSNVIIGNVNTYFCYTTVEIKGHSDSAAARNITINGRIFGLHCNNGVIVRHIGHGDPSGGTTDGDGENPGATPDSPSARNVWLGDIFIESPLVWLTNGATEQAFRVYAYENVNFRSLTVTQGDAPSDYYGADPSGADGVMAVFWSGRDCDFGKVTVNGFAASQAAVRITSSSEGSVQVGPVITRDGPIYGVYHTGGARLTVRDGFDLHRTSETSGSIGIYSTSPAKLHLGDGKFENFETDHTLTPNPKGRWQTIAMSGVESAVTGTTSETELVRVTVPGGLMGPNGQLKIFTLTDQTENSNSKTLRIALDDGDDEQDIVDTSSPVSGGGVYTRYTIVTNRDDDNSQVMNSPGASEDFAETTANISPTTIDTSDDFDVVFYGTLSDVADSFAIGAHSVEVCYRD
ncbi:hypothetical protein O4H61_03265 [Roseovarius aestuarii]|nr:hypothetical protein [Roseovarius aestuarii]